MPYENSLNTNYKESTMNFTFETKNGVLIAKVLPKRATVEFSADFKEQLLEKIEKETARVVVDLSNVEFVDSSFLGALVAGLKRTTMKDGDLKIVGLQPSVRSMFELTRLYRIFDIFEKIEEAIDSF